MRLEVVKIAFFDWYWFGESPADIFFNVNYHFFLNWINKFLAT